MAKNPISFPDEERDEGFKPFLRQEEAVETPSRPASPTDAPSGSETFVLEREFVSLFLKEPLVQSIIEEQVQQRLKERFDELKNQVGEESRLEGIQQGKEEALCEARIQQDRWREANSAKLNELLSAILKEKERFLKDHEKEWSQALIHLLKRFQVPLAKKLGDGIKTWLCESLEQFAETKSVQIYLSEGDFEMMRASLMAKESDRWQWLCDPALASGEVRYEVAGGGVFFDASKEFKKLESWLEEVSHDYADDEAGDEA